MSWLGKSMWAKVEKNTFFKFQQRLTVCFFPVRSSPPENASLCALQTKSASVTLLRESVSSREPKNTASARLAKRSHLTIACPAKLFLTLQRTLKSKRDFAATYSLDTAARAVVQLKSYLKYSFFHLSRRLTYYVANFSGSCPLLEYIELQGEVKELVVMMMSLITTQPFYFHHSRYPRATGILGVSKYVVNRR